MITACYANTEGEAWEQAGRIRYCRPTQAMMVQGGGALVLKEQSWVRG